jgi:hypothetical protein
LITISDQSSDKSEASIWDRSGTKRNNHHRQWSDWQKLRRPFSHSYHNCERITPADRIAKTAEVTIHETVTRTESWEGMTGSHSMCNFLFAVGDFRYEIDLAHFGEKSLLVHTQTVATWDHPG